MNFNPMHQVSGNFGGGAAPTNFSPGFGQPEMHGTTQLHQDYDPNAVKYNGLADQNSNLDALTGMSAMDGMNRMENPTTEVNLTVAKVEQVYQKTNAPSYNQSGSHAEDPERRYEPGEDKSKPIGISRFHNTKAVGCVKP